jgi:hypothetical protein
MFRSTRMASEIGVRVSSPLASAIIPHKGSKAHRFNFCLHRGL